MTSLTSAVVSDIMNVVTKKIKGTFFLECSLFVFIPEELL